MALVIADTDVLIDALHGRDPMADRITIGIETGSLATTAISAFELLSGAATEHTRQQVERLLAALTILPVDAEAGGAAADARRLLESRGIPIGMADCLIAGVCLTRSAPLLTRNHAHFSQIPTLRLTPLPLSNREHG